MLHKGGIGMLKRLAQISMAQIRLGNTELDEDGYYINIMQVTATNKKVSRMNFYAYRIMVTTGSSNHNLNCRQLFLAIYCEHVR